MRRRDFVAGLGGAAAWPLAARAQQRPMPVIGLLGGGTASATQPQIAAIRRGLAEEGFVEGRNVEILFRWAENHYQEVPALAADLVRRRVAVIVAAGGNASVPLAATALTKTIPIVFATGGDPVKLGLVASLNHPGANATGVSFLTVALTAKRLELLHELLPTVSTVAFLVNPTSTQSAADIMEAEMAARILGVRLVILNASTPNEIEADFATLVAQQIPALMVEGDTVLGAQGKQLAALAARHAVPAIFHIREIVEAGGLMSYGANIFDAFRLAGTYVGRILKGDKPGDLPVQQSARFEMVFNLKTAKALGIEVPTATLLRATEVIE